MIFAAAIVYPIGAVDRRMSGRQDLRGFAALRLAGWELLHQTDLDATNTEDEPQRVRLRGPRRSARRCAADGGAASCSWRVLRVVPRA